MHLSTHVGPSPSPAKVVALKIALISDTGTSMENSRTDVIYTQESVIVYFYLSGVFIEKILKGFNFILPNSHSPSANGVT